MGKLNSRRKGARGELEFAKELQEMGFQARRGRQYCGDPSAPDVVSDLIGLHWEIKRVQKFNAYEAIEQAESDCGDSVPVVAHRRNGKQWLLVMKARDLKRFAQRIAEATRQGQKLKTESE